MTQLFLVRHGPTHAKTMVGWSDIPADLSDTAAIARLDTYLPRQAAVVSSDLIRAIATADAIENGRVRAPHDAGLRELNFGDWELRSFADIEADDPELSRAYWEHPGDVRPPGGESWHDAHTRLKEAVDAQVAAFPDQDLIIVAHFGAILTQIQRAGRLDNTQAFSHRIDNLSVSQIQISQGQWTLGAINHCP